VNVHALETAAPRPSNTSRNGVAGRSALSVPLSILVVEDDDSTRKALAKTVRSLGYACRDARDGLEAWEMHQRDRADVILSDWSMPRMDGLELCRRTRSFADEGGYTYFIFMTSFADKEHILRGMVAGADDYHPKPVDVEELEARLVSAGRVIALYRELAEKNAALRRDSQASFQVARVDALTQVANRLAMVEDLEAVWSRVERYGHRYSVALCDIDKFKDYNDRFGHIAGDEVLRRVAQTIRKTLRQGDSLYRYGGEEFLILLPEQPLSEAVRAMERVRAGVENMVLLAAASPRRVTLSFGVAELDSERDVDPEGWLRRADAALYRAKSAGRNRVETDRPPKKRA
jgi:diguanylate cyclase (GGDEF)-like protein